MLKNNRAYFTAIFLGVVVLDLLASSFGYDHFRVVSKPLILVSLLIYFISAGRHLKKNTFYLTILALFCSLLGDVFLLFEEHQSIFFTLGLASFLIAHLVYAVIFFKKRNKSPSLTFWLVPLLLLIYGALFFLYLKDSLGALKIPVIFYVLGISAMSIFAFRRKGSVSSLSFKLVFAGALCFVFSDSILAINKFALTVPLSNILIMGTYALAQYLITMGILKQENVY